MHREFVFDGAGAPIGFRCMCETKQGDKCHRLLKTARGMNIHLKIVHGINTQIELQLNGDFDFGGGGSTDGVSQD